jgi:hypothetical protein
MEQQLFGLKLLELLLQVHQFSVALSLPILLAILHFARLHDLMQSFLQ